MSCLRNSAVCVTLYAARIILSHELVSEEKRERERER